MFRAELDALQAFQHSLLGTLKDLGTQATGSLAAAGESTWSASSAGSTTPAGRGFGSFTEATALNAAYTQTLNDLVKQYQDVSKLAGTIVDALSDTAKKYADTETQLTDQFNGILKQMGL